MVLHVRHRFSSCLHHDGDFLETVSLAVNQRAPDCRAQHDPALDVTQTWQPGRSCSAAQYAVCRAAHSLVRSSADVAHWKLDPP